MKNLMKLSVVLVAAALAFSSCNCFKKMAKNRDDINLTVTPEILTLNNGIVAADINVTFPVKYFNAKAVIKVTPVIVFEGGEVAGAAKYLQGSKVDENYTVVDKKNGGSYTLTGITRGGQPLQDDDTVTVTCLATEKQMAPLLQDESRAFERGEATVKDAWSEALSGGSVTLAAPESYITFGGVMLFGRN